MSTSSRVRAVRRFAVAALLFALVLTGGWLFLALQPVPERVQPDRLDLGEWAPGSQIECSARFLTGTGPSRFDLAANRFISWFPQPLDSWIARCHPRRLRLARNRQVNLETLQPRVIAPDWMDVVSVQARQNTNWYDGAPFVDVGFLLKTDRPGLHQAHVRVQLGRREAALPVRFSVRTGNPVNRRSLVVDSPFNDSAAESGRELAAAAALLASLPGRVDVRMRVPEDLTPYHVILLADAGLVLLDEAGRRRVEAFIERGGRLILSGNAFMSGSVQQANALLEPHGIKLVDRDQVRQVTVTHIASDPLTAGVKRLGFFRPSLIRVSGPPTSRLLASDEAGEGGFVAVARPEGRGEIVVLGVSLWWAWLHQFADSSDNARLLRNLFDVGGEELRPATPRP